MLNQAAIDTPGREGSLYDPALDHDACGTGFIAQVSGKRSHQILRYGLQSLCNLTHRGALDADAKTGDGAGVLTQIPYKIFAPEVARLGHQLYNDRDLGVGFVFLPHDNAYAQARTKAITEEVLTKRGLFLFGWRPVPIHLGVLGDKAQLTMPRMEQALIGRPWGLSDDDYERRLFLSRNEIEKRAADDRIKNVYIPSFSSRAIAYKGLLVSPSLEKFYVDLGSRDYESAFCIYHQRYSTNTFPTWPLAHPFRMLAHNGEINTVRGNRNWMHAREAELRADFWGKDIDLLKPIIQPGGSDSASIDNALEALVMSGRSLLHAVTMLVPPAWRADRSISPELAAFYQYNACFNEPWDGPAALIFSDGRTVGACLDRNGLRPARYCLTEDGLFALGSEVGATGIDSAQIIEKGRLGPGEMIAVDTVAGKLLRDAEIKESLAQARPYRKWIKDNLLRLSEFMQDAPAAEPPVEMDILTLTQRQIAFGYSSEELDMVLRPMLQEAAEGVGSMGDDTPLAVLSSQPRLLYTYFKQLFAQVTNPPIDPIREKLVMSLSTIMGWRRNLLAESPDHCHLVVTDTPFLTERELDALGRLPEDHKSQRIGVLWPVASGEAGLKRQLELICGEAEQAVDAGTRIIILSDRGVDHENVAVPMLLAIAATHHHLIRAGKRMKVSLVCDTGEARDVHHMACLIGYGASAICPYLAFETCREILDKEPTIDLSLEKARSNYLKALESGLLKIMSKMGISVLGSYRGAQVFEAIGLGSKLVEQCFTGTSSQIEGIGLPEIARETLAAARAGLPAGGARRRRGRAAARSRTVPLPARRRDARGDAADDQEFPHVREDERERGLREVRGGSAGLASAFAARFARAGAVRVGPGAAGRGGIDRGNPAALHHRGHEPRCDRAGGA